MATHERTLGSAPPMLALFARAGVAMIPGASKLPFIGGGGGRFPTRRSPLRTWKPIATAWPPMTGCVASG